MSAMIFVMTIFQVGGLIGYVGYIILDALNKQTNDLTGELLVSNNTLMLFDTAFALLCPVYDLVIPIMKLENAN